MEINIKIKLYSPFFTKSSRRRTEVLTSYRETPWSGSDVFVKANDLLSDMMSSLLKVTKKTEHGLAHGIFKFRLLLYIL